MRYSDPRSWDRRLVFERIPTDSAELITVLAADPPQRASYESCMVNRRLSYDVGGRLKSSVRRYDSRVAGKRMTKQASATMSPMDDAARTFAVAEVTDLPRLTFASTKAGVSSSGSNLALPHQNK